MARSVGSRRGLTGSQRQRQFPGSQRRRQFPEGQRQRQFRKVNDRDSSGNSEAGEKYRHESQVQAKKQMQRQRSGFEAAREGRCGNKAFQSFDDATFAGSPQALPCSDASTQTCFTCLNSAPKTPTPLFLGKREIPCAIPNNFSQREEKSPPLHFLSFSSPRACHERRAAGAGARGERELCFVFDAALRDHRRRLHSHWLARWARLPHVGQPATQDRAGKVHLRSVLLQLSSGTKIVQQVKSYLK
eukprot:6203274-Pleurochrysis_carterae.AAC.1